MMVIIYEGFTNNAGAENFGMIVAFMMYIFHMKGFFKFEI